MSTDKTARQRFEAGFNCAQAILSRFGPDFGLDAETANRLGAALGGGFGNMGRTCGAVSGGCLVLGLRFGAVSVDPENATRINALTREFIQRFEERHGTAMCRGLIKCNIRDESSLKRATDQGVFSMCPGYVESAEGLLLEMIKESKPG